MVPMKLIPLASAALLLCAVSACAPAEESDTAGSDAAVTLADCQAADLPLATDGTLTIATDTPAYEPWFSDDDPTNGKGFESAVAYAVADRLGFAKDDVTWVVQGFNQAVQPGAKDWDFDINQFSITPERENAVDFSSPYYSAPQAIITLEDSPYADATSLADLEDAKIGAQIGTTSLEAVDQIGPSSDTLVYDDTTKAAQALQNGQADVIVADLPTAFYLTSVEIDGSTVAGQFVADDAEGEDFGLLLPKDSELTPCASAAVDDLESDGTLADLEQTWLSDTTDVPVLK